MKKEEFIIIIKIEIKNDHIHLFMIIPPKYAVSKVAEAIKKNTSRSLSRKFTFLKKVYGGKVILYLLKVSRL
ncbi:MAG TPA: hypothetical protein DCK79_09105 [Candidatus Atribacteria bacterium]|nr:hypothetical protein [Candidatus Atribacteria bacterium]